MRQFFPVEELARDERFTQINMRQSEADPRSGLLSETPGKRPKTNRLTPDRADASDAARSLMHGIFVGEIQAMEGAGRTAFDYGTDGSPRRIRRVVLDCFDIPARIPKILV